MMCILRSALPILIVLLALALACSEKSSTGSGGAVDIEDLLVRNNEITGWTYSDAGWVARNSEQLYAQINGAGVPYVRDYGFVEGAGQEYEGTIDSATRELEIWVFDLGTESNAKGAYDDPQLRPSGVTPWTDGAGQEAYYKRFGLSQKMSFYRGPYIAILDMAYDTDESLNIIKQFALNIDGKIE
jgi:hypothetical protein